METADNGSRLKIKVKVNEILLRNKEEAHVAETKLSPTAANVRLSCRPSDFLRTVSAGISLCISVSIPSLVFAFLILSTWESLFEYFRVSSSKLVDPLLVGLYLKF